MGGRRQRACTCVSVGICALGALVLAQTSLAQSAQPCTPDPLSYMEATRLLEYIPSALYAAAHGAKVGVDSWDPGASYPHDLFYFFVLYGAGPNSGADGGLLGYFAVNKVTGTIFELSVPPGEVVTGTELAKVQKILRKLNCVDEATLRKYQSADPNPRD